MQGQYSLEKTIKYPNLVARIYRPILTEDEKNRRMREIQKATANLVKDVQNEIHRKTP